MTRATNAPAAKRRKAKYLKAAKGFRGASNNRYTLAREIVERAMAFSYRDRKVKKRDFRGLWIIRIGAAAKANGLSYSRLINGLIKANIAIDRKMLAELAVNNATVFTKLVEIAKQSA